MYLTIHWNRREHRASQFGVKLVMDMDNGSIKLDLSDLDGQIIENLTQDGFRRDYLNSNESSPEFLDRANAFISYFKNGDLICCHCSPQKDWDIGAGVEGVVLVRDGKIVNSLVLKMN